MIHLEQGRRYALDFHLRATLRIGSSAGPSVTVDDVTDHFLADAGPDVATPVFNLTSAYVLYPASLDATDYVAHDAPATAPQHGGAFTATQADGSTPSTMTSFSSLGYGDTRG